MVKYAWVCVYAPVNAGNLWNDVNECPMENGRESRMVLIGDMNGRVGNRDSR